MADSIKREQIILADKTIVETVSRINTVVRTIPSFNEISNFANEQLPVAAVVGRLPVSENHFSKSDDQVDYCLSILKVDVSVFFQDNVSPDSTVSLILNDLWKALYLDPTRSNLVIRTWLIPEEEVEILDSYHAFRLIINHQYQHTPGGI